MGRRLRHLRLVEPVELDAAPPVLTSPASQREFKELTERLVDVAIEIVDLIEGDPELEPDDPLEEDDPREKDEPVEDDEGWR